MGTPTAVTITITTRGSNFNLLGCITHVVFLDYELHEYICVCVPSIMPDEAMYLSLHQQHDMRKPSLM